MDKITSVINNFDRTCSINLQNGKSFKITFGVKEVTGEDQETILVMISVNDWFTVWSQKVNGI